MRQIVVFIAFFTCGCYAEFDNGFNVPRRDPCTGHVTYGRIHPVVGCRLPAPTIGYPYQ